MFKKKKTIKIKYVDFWPSFSKDDFIIDKILNKHYIVLYSDDPDYIICSCFGVDFQNYSCIRVFYTGENYSTNLNIHDYGIDFDRYTYSDRHYQLPNYVLSEYKDVYNRMKNKHLGIDDSLINRNFCSFVYSNHVALREVFFNKLTDYKKIDSAGKVLNNTKIDFGVKAKLEFEMNHKFSIAFENSSREDYITEKLVQSFAAKTIPVYWGAGNVTDYFNEKAMIILKDEADIPRVIDRIKEIDNNDELYLEMLKQPAIRPDKQEMFDNYLPGLESFICNIFDQDLKDAKRRSSWSRKPFIHY